MLKGIKNHCIPTTSSNVYWKQWDQVSQIQHGNVQRVGVTTIEIDRIMEWLQGKIPDTIKIQKFLDVMHLELRHAIESGINTDKFDWEEIVALAKRHDREDSLFQAGKYVNKEDRRRQKPSLSLNIISFEQSISKRDKRKQRNSHQERETHSYINRRNKRSFVTSVARKNI